MTSSGNAVPIEPRLVGCQLAGRRLDGAVRRRCQIGSPALKDGPDWPLRGKPMNGLEASALFCIRKSSAAIATVTGVDGIQRAHNPIAVLAAPRSIRTFPLARSRWALMAAIRLTGLPKPSTYPRLRSTNSK